MTNITTLISSSNNLVVTQNQNVPQQNIKLTDERIQEACTQCFAAASNEPLYEFRRIGRLPLDIYSIVISYFKDEKNESNKETHANEQEIVRKVSMRIQEGWTVNECTDKVIRDLLITKTKLLFESAEQRKSTYSTNLKTLDSGFWYANDYFAALKAKKQFKRIDYFRNKGNFYHGLAPKGFTHVPDPKGITGTVSGFGAVHYKLQEGFTAAEGLLNARGESLSFTDCQNTLAMASYEVCLQIFGEKRFNKNFNANGTSPLTFNNALERTSITRFFTINMGKTKGKLGKRPVRLGDQTYFKNLPVYSTKHYQGEAGGFHVVCIQDTPVQKYLGFGLPLKGVTDVELYDFFAAEFNKQGIKDEEIISPELQLKLDPPSEEMVRQVRDITLTRDAYIQTESTHPNLVGFVPRIVSPNLQAIHKELADKVS